MGSVGDGRDPRVPTPSADLRRPTCSRSSTPSCPARDRGRHIAAILEIPESYRGVTVHKDEEEMFAGQKTRDKDPRVPARRRRAVPELGPGEALIAVMASAR